MFLKQYIGLRTKHSIKQKISFFVENSVRHRHKKLIKSERLINQHNQTAFPLAINSILSLLNLKNRLWYGGVSALLFMVLFKKLRVCCYSEKITIRDMPSATQPTTVELLACCLRFDPISLLLRISISVENWFARR